MHLPGHNFIGPGTKLNKRLNPDLTPKAWPKTVNRVDQAANHHDICYVKTKKQKLAMKFVIKICWKNLMVFVTLHFEKGLIVELLDRLHYATKIFLCRGWDVFWILFGR